MSLKVLTWVWADAPITNHLELLVMLALADEADDNGGSCYPSLRRIGAKARCSPSTAGEAIARLEALDLVVCYRPEKKGRGHHNSYVVVVPWAEPPPDKGSGAERLESEKRAETFGPGRAFGADKRAETRGPGPNVPIDPTPTTDPRPDLFSSGSGPVPTYVAGGTNPHPASTLAALRGARAASIEPTTEGATT